MVSPENIKHAAVFYGSAFSKFNQGDFQGAVRDCSRAIELDPTYIDSYFVRGNAKHALQDFQGAIADFTTAIELDPNDTDAYCNRGVSKYYLKDIEGAFADLRQANALGNSRAHQIVREMKATIREQNQQR